MPYVDPIEEQVQEAIARGDFDDLPGAGRPLRLRDTRPGWWARRKAGQIRAQELREDLARRVRRLEDGLWVLEDEDSVRRQVEAINRQIDAINSRLAPDDPLERLEAERLIRTWRKMYRARR